MHWKPWFLAVLVCVGACEDPAPTPDGGAARDAAVEASHNIPAPQEPEGPCGVFGDSDGDGVCDVDDVCPLVFDPEQLNSDGDAKGDACDFDERLGCEEWEDFDEDGVCDRPDNCPAVYNPAQLDSDQDGVGDACDPPNDCDDFGGDSDGDGRCDPHEDTDPADSGDAGVARTSARA